LLKHGKIITISAAVNNKIAVLIWGEVQGNRGDKKGCIRFALKKNPKIIFKTGENENYHPCGERTKNKVGDKRWGVINMHNAHYLLLNINNNISKNNTQQGSTRERL
jgi:hypothetical protein